MLNPIVGTPGDDNLIGTAQGDHILGLAGNDTISGQDGNDIIEGGDGTDFIAGGSGDDFLDGGAGDVANNVLDFLFGEEGNDTLTAEFGFLNGGPGDDVLIDGVYYYETSAIGGVFVNVSSVEQNFGGVVVQGRTAIDEYGSIDSFTGSIDSGHLTSFADVVWMDEGYVFARGGDDVIIQTTTGGFVSPGSGNDVIIGAASGELTIVDYFDGGGDDFGPPTQGVFVNLQDGIVIDNWGFTDNLTNIDWVNGSELEDVILGNDNDNFFLAYQGDDTINAGGGNDNVEAGEGDDVIIDGPMFPIGGSGGNPGNDKSVGNAGENPNGRGPDFWGNGGRGASDGKGNSKKAVDSGDDVYSGGEGADTFIFIGSIGDDVITDFEAGDTGSDVLDLCGVGINSFDEAINVASDTQDGVLFDFGAAGTLALNGVTIGDLTQDDILNC
ncbi:calcium-binding protein [Ruegeria sp. AD91A]|uniref:calcium-binding protein n=1 Tax=Ruegeria sp. AD91A TaxID=2293862 RepID=UPI000E4C75D0|nr:calcium-binding protein [Ruegeria sp. AD91A]AXT25539.1 calcium-binding protein [Ruegeria sp. AD91A]